MEQSGDPGEAEGLEPGDSNFSCARDHPAEGFLRQAAGFLSISHTLGK